MFVQLSYSKSFDMLQLLFSKGMIALLLTSWTASINNWIVEKRRGYTTYYTTSDQLNKKEYVELIDKGIRSVRHFFGESYKSGFTVFVHPDRHSLDSSWQKDLNMPGFKSECWMVASGSGMDLFKSLILQKYHI